MNARPVSWIARGLVMPIRCYQRWISPLKPPTCRFTPTCSAYAVEAIQVHGPWRGLWLGVRRICRCHPWHPGGHDPVPGTTDEAEAGAAPTSNG
jgi:putative membrane protein insertion efficiency factor